VVHRGARVRVGQRRANTHRRGTAVGGSGSRRNGVVVDLEGKSDILVPLAEGDDLPQGAWKFDPTHDVYVERRRSG
jgi:hypothetical protein